MSATETANRINVTDAAAAKVGQLISEEPESENLHLRVAVKPGGCSGFSYEMYFDTDVNADDIAWTVGNNVRIVVDSASSQMLEGATLDYSDSLQSAGFNIDNPNASRTCGCGNSFS